MKMRIGNISFHSLRENMVEVGIAEYFGMAEAIITHCL
jgi:hypothetical protein